jgi:hypothetical protein
MDQVLEFEQNLIFLMDDLNLTWVKFIHLFW